MSLLQMPIDGINFTIAPSSGSTCEALTLLRSRARPNTARMERARCFDVIFAESPTSENFFDVCVKLFTLAIR